MRLLALRLFTSAMLGSLVVASFYTYTYLTTSDKLAIARIDFSGLSRLTASDVEDLLADVQGQNILLLSLVDYAKRFTDHPRIRRTSLKRVLPNRVLCTVEEREPVALVYRDRFLEVDEEGMVMTADELTTLLDLPIISGFEQGGVREGQYCRDDRFLGALELLDLCKRYGGDFAQDISEVRVDEQGASIVSLTKGTTLLVGRTNFESRLKKFFLMKGTIADRNETARLIDLRFDDQIVLRSGI